MSEAVKRKSRLARNLDEFRAKSALDKRRTVTDLLFNNAMYIIIAIAIVYIAIRVPTFLSTSSIINIISLTAAKLPIALGIGGAIVLTGTDISAGRCVGLTACIAAALLQKTDYANKIFPNLNVMPLWAVLLWLLVKRCQEYKVPGIVSRVFSVFLCAAMALGCVWAQQGLSALGSMTSGLLTGAEANQITKEPFVV